MGGEVGVAVLTHLMEPVHLVVLEVDRTVLSAIAATAAGDHPVVEGADVDAAAMAAEVDREAAAQSRARRAARGLEGVCAQLPEVALQVYLRTAELPLDAHAAAGELSAAVDAGQGLHLSLEVAGQGADGGTEERGDLEVLGLVGPIDFAQHVGGHFGADGPEILDVLLRPRMTLGELELQERVRLGGRLGDRHHRRHKAGLVGDDLVEPGGKVLEEEVALRVRHHLASGEVSELVGVDLGRRQRRPLAQHPPGDARKAGARLRTLRARHQGEGEDQGHAFAKGWHPGFSHDLALYSGAVNPVKCRSVILMSGHMSCSNVCST